MIAAVAAAAVAPHRLCDGDRFRQHPSLCPTPQLHPLLTASSIVVSALRFITRDVFLAKKKGSDHRRWDWLLLEYVPVEIKEEAKPTLIYRFIFSFTNET